MVNTLLLGGAGFIGTNLALSMIADKTIKLTIADRHYEKLNHIIPASADVIYRKVDFSESTNFDDLVHQQDVVYHLISTIIPGTSNQHIPEELAANIIVTARLLDACVRQKVKKVIFLSSGGAVYGKKGQCPIKEDMVTYPITSYGVQKLTIEKLLYLYRYLYHLDYRVIRLANPYGPYQRPNSGLGVITTFLYKAMLNEPIQVFGDVSIVRDFIYIDDDVKAIRNIANGESEYRIFNLGSGTGHSVKQIIETIEKVLDKSLKVTYASARKSDVPANYLDISRYESMYGRFDYRSLEDGIRKTANFMKGYYGV